MREIVPGIHTWSWFSSDKGIDFNGYYVLGPGGPVVVDPPPCREEHLARMALLGAPRVILITNGHHLRKARDLAARFGVPIRIHAADAGMIEPPPDGTFGDGDRLPGGLTAIGIPDGKTPGETALHAPWANALIVGDAVIGKPAGSLSLLPADKFKDPARARLGLRRLLDVPFASILVGDGSPIIGRGKEALRELLAVSGAPS
jgi:glyoxylase-like metal-dependent hydrolase (beta-lactamase superfamily II)